MNCEEIVKNRGQDSTGYDQGVLASQSRTLRNSLISLSVFFVVVVLLLLAVPDLHSAADRIAEANLSWVLIGVLAEILSCVGYVVLFGLVFGRLSPGLSSRLSLSELAVNSVVSVSGLAGIALGAWVLRSKGVSVERIARRSVLIFVLTSAVNVGAVVLIGVLMWLGVLPGSRNALLTLLPAGAALASILATVWLAAWARHTAEARADTDERAGTEEPVRKESRLTVALVAVSGGVEEALQLILAREWRLLGALAYWLLDNFALFACLEAFGHSLSFWAVVMAYLVGMLANSIPVPGGFVAVESGLAGMLALFGARPASLVIAAVLVYRAISLWVPARLGSLAFLSLRREIGKPLAPTAAG